MSLFRSTGCKVLDAESKDQQRIASLKARKEARVGRMLNAKERMFGIDAQTIEEQKQENIRKKELEEEQKLIERMQNDQILRILEKRDETISHLKKQEQNKMIHAWRNQQAEIHRRKIMEEEEKKIDMEPCLNNAQKFEGEDDDLPIRQAHQQRQMKLWCQEAVDRKAEEKRRQRDIQRKEIEDLNAIEFECLKNQMEQEKLEKMKIERVKEANRSLMMEREVARDLERRSKMEAARLEREHVKSSALLNEHDQSRSALANHRYRPDHFKGYSNTQLDEIRALQKRQQALKKEENERQMLIEERETFLQQRLIDQLEKQEVELAKQKEESKQQHRRAIEMQIQEA
eukprot:TRINITY_DN2428_c0_g1_i2.p1 TRINITY_DN2428_c0_g1~~TRINITY_DN2428_c0_g1_i2.p1  ORF type:complete len:345 (+),score=122.42 TRINITY_DN2428_c0_g1_i2:89-1123(+)